MISETNNSCLAQAVSMCVVVLSVYPGDTLPATWPPLGTCLSLESCLDYITCQVFLGGLTITCGVKLPFLYRNICWHVFIDALGIMLVGETESEQAGT